MIKIFRHESLLAAATLVAGVTGATIAVAQQPPGVVVSTPGLSVAMPPPPPAQAQQPKAAAPAPKPKPKPKAVAATTTGAISDDAQGVKGGQAIKVLVNDEPITAYEIEIRSRFLAMSSNIGQQAAENYKRLATSDAVNQRFRAQAEQIIRENQGRRPREQIIEMIEQKKRELAQSLQKQAIESARAANVPKFRKDAQEELIDEKLKLQEAKKLGIDIPEDDVNKILRGIAERNKLTEQQFAQNLKNAGTDVSVMRARYQSALAWREVVRRKFSAQISVAQRDVEKLVAQTAGADEDTVELQIQKITLAHPAKLDQAAMAQRFAEADGIRRKFGGCKSTGQIAQGIAGAKFEDLRYVRPSSVGEPTRSFLLSAKDGDMLPPQTGASGVEIYTVCGRRALKGDEKKREAAQQELQSREFELLARRHLRDLRQDAHIEYR